MSISAAQYAAMTKKPKRPKYGNRRTTVDGITFDSKGEAARYSFLVLLQRIGSITGLERQVPYPLTAPNGTVVGIYRADFTYHTAAGDFVCEDFKSRATITQAFRSKARHMKAEHGITVHLVFEPNAPIPTGPENALPALPEPSRHNPENET